MDSLYLTGTSEDHHAQHLARRCEWCGLITSGRQRVHRGCASSRTRARRKFEATLRGERPRLPSWSSMPERGLAGLAQEVAPRWRALFISNRHGVHVELVCRLVEQVAQGPAPHEAVALLACAAAAARDTVRGWDRLASGAVQ